jgi:chromosome partitioning protein
VAKASSSKKPASTKGGTKVMAGKAANGKPAKKPVSSAAPAGKRAAAAAAAAPVAKTTEQKLEEFYGVKQVGDDVVFVARFKDAKKVMIAGDFNNWMPVSTPMQPAGRPGEWRMRLPLNPGRYRYRLVVDGQWITDPNNQYVEANQFGELNNIVEVA